MTEVSTMQTLLRDALDRLDNYHRQLEMLSHTLLGKGHVICMPGNLFLSLETEPDPDHPGRHRVVSCAPHGNPLKASQLTKEDAERVAADSTNGFGEIGEAIHIRDALERCIKSDQSVVDLLNRRIEEAQEHRRQAEETRS